MKLLAVYVGTTSEIGRINLQHGLQNGIWGFKEGSKPVDFGTLSAGDVILLATGHNGGGPRISSEDWANHNLASIAYATITGEPFHSVVPEWPDEGSLAEAERYKWRVRFAPDSIQIIKNIPLKDRNKLSAELAEQFRKSGAANGRGYVLDGSHFPIVCPTNNDAKAGEAEIVSQLEERHEPLDAKSVDAFEQALQDAGVVVSRTLVIRMLSSLVSKNFVLLTGLAGSGKTKIAQALARWLPSSSNCSRVVAVGADWTGNENVLGYPNGLEKASYISKPSLDVILHAKGNQAIPHFLILDEMNLSHVERYFADILSAIESDEKIHLHQDSERKANGTAIPSEVQLPKNLFIIGTVNVDETTYMFSPKVLDRANVIEFRMEAEEIAAFLDAPKAVRLEELDGKGAAFGASFVAAAADKGRTVPAEVQARFKEEMLLFFTLLQKHHAEFGYRTSYEAGRFIHFYKELGGYEATEVKWFDEAMDAVIVQKLLPKLHGSRTKLEGLLWALAYACGTARGKLTAEDYLKACEVAGEAEDEKRSPEAVAKALADQKARFPLSFDKLLRMHRKLVRDQFVTFAEA